MPAAYMREESPCQPSRITVMSMFRTSPSSSFRSPGIPWQTTWLIDVQIDFGKPRFQGTGDEVGASEVVRRAYLGEEGLGSKNEAIELDGARA